MKQIILWVAIIGGLILMVVALAHVGTKTSTGPAATLETPVADDEHTKGNPNAPLTLVEYSDFQCPACASMYPIIKQLSTTFPDDLKVVYRHFPLRQIHAQAQLAAEAAEAAGEQNKFWEMHDLLFNTQREWSDNPDARDIFIELAASLGLDEDQFITDMNSKKTKNTISDHYASGASANIPGTPSLFLNGTLIQNPGTYDGFKTLIEDALANS
ncbi:MAG: disulfide bond formation protein DsbA [Candidatus Magasanikbacteria bacterium CG10_big_fil_rev_8_21_14_0_10_43_6]|uniref:Disulfide bond formation protein DsbA n=1 Tax=Candidatus Magasanikbacteria bacterium CG10_big_fil_rev_8_21_14_0_10_43_6 TaxID=1974650 RepID=A0A2M6W0Z2_9BACT|nr:MAG: disulfide bond formation protein DsbA [Candidatus Magasanikbacteria bacterium CG10_big_fil_rev_8_21_14_0_10_43_6]